MAILEVVSGSCPGQIIELQGDRMVLGRHPTCQIVIDNAAVSRNHAQIIEGHGAFYVEDLRSRNGTLVNGARVSGRRELHENDEIRVCEMTFRFHSSPNSGLSSSTVVTLASKESPDSAPRQQAQTIADEKFQDLQKKLFSPPRAFIDDSSSESSSIISMLDVASARHPRLTVRPEAKLQAVMEISKCLARAIDLPQVLPRILESLFNIFPQADRGFVVLKEVESGELQVESMKTRRDDPTESARLSSTIINEAMKSARAILSSDALKDFSKAESLHGLKITSVMCAPLVGHEGHSLGVIQVDTRDARHQFSQDDLDVLASVAAQAALAVENARLHDSVIKKRDFEKELQFANQVQLGFLPTERPTVPNYEFHDFYEAAHRVGGDFFDYISLPDGRLAMSVGDVAGKGVPAALLMARMYSSARSELLSKPTPAKAIEGLNASLVNVGLGHRFVTFVVAVLDPRTNCVTFINAGHLPPLRRNRAGKVDKLAEEEAGLPLGIKPDTEYIECTVQLDPGDMVLLFTDGVTEAMNPANEMYGKFRLQPFLENCPEGAEPMVEALIEDIDLFCKGRPQRDDICMIGFRRIS